MTGYGEEQFRVPKITVEVELLLEGGIVVTGNVHVLPEAQQHAGRERVVDVLEADEPFLPLTATGGARLVAKNRIVVASFKDPIDVGWDEVDQSDPEVQIEALLAGAAPDRQRQAGTILIPMPPGRTRLLDFLNAAGPFFPLRNEQGVMLVAKRYVVEIRQL